MGRPATESPGAAFIRMVLVVLLVTGAQERRAPDRERGDPGHERRRLGRLENW